MPKQELRVFQKVSRKRITIHLVPLISDSINFMSKRVANTNIDKFKIGTFYHIGLTVALEASKSKLI